ncbi:MAG: hypothetical protein RIN55_00930 [Tissierellaceae bacterium]|nr:hypothetical protein [Tissierellaceae bacterium]
MKSNKEFLEGVYNKAKIMEEERKNKNYIYKKYLRFSSIAAIIVILPLLVFRSQIFESNDYVEIPQMARILELVDPQLNFLEADYIVIGKAKKIYKSQYVEESNYIYTDVDIQLENVLLGDIKENEILLRVKGGKVKKNKIFSAMEGEFSKSNKSLLFLNKDENGVYYLVHGSESQFSEIDKDLFVDKTGNTYDLDIIKENIDRR